MTRIKKTAEAATEDQPLPTIALESKFVTPQVHEDIRELWSKGAFDLDTCTAIIDDFTARTALGFATYGKALSTFNGRDALVDAYQEMLDKAQYLRQRIMEGDTSTGLAMMYTNELLAIAIVRKLIYP